MTSAFILSFMFLLTQNLLLNCASAAVHSHSVDTQEREGDGSYRARDFDHYGDSGHNSEFDHEAILGSVKEAEEYDKLSPEESKRRLALLLPKMDVNGDQFIDRNELKEWILNSFRKLSREEAEERMSEADDNRDGVVTWGEYLQDAFGVDAEEEIAPEDTGDTGMLVQEEKVMWHAADLNGDGKLDLNEFEMFTNPEEHELMHGFLVNQTLREKDQNHDGFVDFNEFIGDRGMQQDQSWMVAERDKFDHDLDADRDGRLDAAELRRWVVPDNDEIATEEVEHLFASADDDGDGRLAFEEVLRHHQQFVGSEATDYGNDLMGEHFDDEL
ncbi:reticulocalbin-2-like isoform X2 [Choristoneura fumiferana]|uniref:reticulocalbin-2-like isoform X2 n=1 Tax=Choristoneura fumiferana TaxID=7141 RepID=UPI003D15D703